MSYLKIGATIAAVVTGPPLYIMVHKGLIDSNTALLRVGIVAVACAVGVAVIDDVIRTYQPRAQRGRPGSRAEGCG